MLDYKKLDDFDEIYAVLTDFLDVFPHLCKRVSIKDFSKKLSEYAQVYLQSVDGEDVGFLAFYANNKESKTAFITLIGVKEKHRNRHFGSYLLEFCEKESLKNGFSKIHLEVGRSKKTAIRFYIRNGFSQISQDEKSLYMMKELENK